MSTPPNVLFLMTDQMQGRVLDPGHPCQTPNLDRLAARGVRFSRAYTPNAVCSPARASLMTGLLPHNHGVLMVTHTVDEDQLVLRTDKPHWAQRLVDLGYQTGYFGKWHVEQHDPLSDFGWQVSAETAHGRHRSDLYQRKAAQVWGGAQPEDHYALAQHYSDAWGYSPTLFYGVTDVPPEQRAMGIITALALDYLDQVLVGDEPWCCFVSVPEPHDPFVTGQDAFERYDIDALDLQPNVHDELAGRPGIYRKAARVWREMTDRQHREAATCYYASITEIDAQFGRIIDRVERAGQLENTIVVFTSDHGESLGAHGLYCKNFSASEEIYTIPLIVTGPGLASGVCTSARVGSHDLCPTLLELTGAEPFAAPDSRSFAAVLRDPAGSQHRFTTGFAEYYGNRMIITQRVVWNGEWKFVFNGFDFDELYNLEQDPWEMHNLAEDPAYASQLRALTARMWRIVRDTGDHSLYNSHYPILRVAPYGPLIAEDEPTEEDHAA
ncbi:MAG: sulfatase-like hydrolase/transferase [Anaerolineae bacterium]|nr:sulfatase-like hydrolase/transferase [Anaerolineae bacterium]